MCFYNAFCKKKNEKKCGDIRNTQAVVSQPTHVLENKRILFSCSFILSSHSCVGKQKEFLFSCSFILSFHSGEGICFSRGEEKRILIYIVFWRKNFCAQEKYIVFRRSSNAKTKSNNSPEHYFARNKLVTNRAAECVKVHIQRCNGAYKLSQLQYIATQLLYTTQCPSFRIFPASAYH